MEMTVSAELAEHWKDRYVVLVLDNEVTLSHFVAQPPLPWARMVHSAGEYRVAEGYPQVMDATAAQRERRNWDQVDPAGIEDLLRHPGAGVDCFVIGNNAGQGLPLAAVLDEARRAAQTVVIFGASLPERDRYEALGYREFCARADVLPRLLERGRAAGRKVALAFINTIQHNESNYHDP